MAISEWRVEKLEMELHTTKLQLEALSIIVAKKIYGIVLGSRVTVEDKPGEVVKLGTATCYVKLDEENYSREFCYEQVKI